MKGVQYYSLSMNSIPQGGGILKRVNGKQWYRLDGHSQETRACLGLNDPGKVLRVPRIHGQVSGGDGPRLKPWIRISESTAITLAPQHFARRHHVGGLDE